MSEFSKSEIIKYFKVKPNKIVVIPNAWQHYSGIQYDENTLDNYGLKKNQYYFAMGSMEPNKNFKWIAEMAKKIRWMILQWQVLLTKNICRGARI